VEVYANVFEVFAGMYVDDGAQTSVKSEGILQIISQKWVV